MVEGRNLLSLPKVLNGREGSVAAEIYFRFSLVPGRDETYTRGPWKNSGPKLDETTTPELASRAGLEPAPLCLRVKLFHL